MSDLVPCVFCQYPVEDYTISGRGTQWRHTDGYTQCRPTYASPNFLFPQNVRTD